MTVLDAGSVTATLAGTDYDVDVTFTAPSTKYYSVFVATEGPNGNLGRRRPENRADAAH